MTAVHWSDIGDARAPDMALMEWARDHQHAVFTNDLDFGAMLALTHAARPSVLQVRGQNVLPEHLGLMVLAALRAYEVAFLAGAIVVVDEQRARARVLPL